MYELSFLLKQNKENVQHIVRRDTDTYVWEAVLLANVSCTWECGPTLLNMTSAVTKNEGDNGSRTLRIDARIVVSFFVDCR